VLRFTGERQPFAPESFVINDRFDDGHHVLLVSSTTIVCHQYPTSSQGIHFKSTIDVDLVESTNVVVVVDE
jgi:hypothetical protein